MSAILPAPPSPTRLRALLEEMVVKDLLGPAGGPEEELVERSVRDRYLVGVLAPRRRREGPDVGNGPPPSAGEGDDEEGEFPPVLNDDLAEEGIDEPEDGPADLAVPLPRATEPSSFGLSFCVEGTARGEQALLEARAVVQSQVAAFFSAK